MNFKKVSLVQEKFGKTLFFALTVEILFITKVSTDFISISGRPTASCFLDILMNWTTNCRQGKWNRRRDPGNEVAQLCEFIELLELLKIQQLSKLRK